VVTGLAIVGFGGPAGCQTQHSPGFQKVRPERTAAAAPAAARPLPEGTAEGVPEHLLHEYAGRDLAPDAEIRTWDLPTKAKRVVVELLILAARDDASRLNTVMTQQARWGAPDRREYDARSVSDDGKVFLDTLRQASSRFARKQNLTCPPIMPPAAQVYVRNGSEPMWCFYGSNDGLDILAFKLVVEGGSAKIDYVGMYAERPAHMIPRTGSQPPPMTPMVRRGPRMPNPNMPGLDGQLGDPNALPGQSDAGGVIINNGQPGAPQPGTGADAGQPGGQPGQPGQPAGSPDQPGAPAGTAAGQHAGSTAGQPAGTAAPRATTGNASPPPGNIRGQAAGATASETTNSPGDPTRKPAPAKPAAPRPGTPKATEPSGTAAQPAGTTSPGQ
jgi:hypothetical protein